MNHLSSQIIVNILRAKMKLPQNNVWLRDQNRLIPNDDQLYISAGIVNSLVMSSETYIREGRPRSTWDMLGKIYDHPNQDPNKYDTTKPETFDVVGQNFDVPGQTYVDAPPSNYDQEGQTFDVPAQNFDVAAPPSPTTEVNRIQMQEFIQIDLFSRSNAAIYRNWEVVAAIQSFYSQQLQELNNFKIFRMPRQFLNTSYAEGGSQLNRYTLTVCCFVWYVKETLLTTNGGDYYDDFTQRVDDHLTIGSEAPYIFDQPGNTFDTPGETFDQKPPLAEFEINQEGIVS